MKKISRRSFVPLLGTALIGASCISLESNKDEDKSSITLLPPRLKKGDTIGVCAPAGGIKDKSEITEFEDKLNKLGFKVKFSEDIDERYGYFASNDEQRAKSFMQLIKDSEVKGIFFIRGGWGCARMIEHLDFNEIKANPKVIMGFSDITTLLNGITHKTGLVTFHGPGGNSSWNPYTWESIEAVILKGEKKTYTIPQNRSLDTTPKTIVSGTAVGKLFGGNLSVISTLLGSEYLPDWEGKILLLEDVMEEPYRIDRMLTHLKLNGVFDKINGLVLGQFRKCIAEELNRSFTVEEVFEQHFSNLSIPVFVGATIGHTKLKHTVPIGSKVILDADAMTLKLAHSCVT